MKYFVLADHLTQLQFQIQKKDIGKHSQEYIKIRKIIIEKLQEI